jgi:hypothetical protein
VVLAEKKGNNSLLLLVMLVLSVGIFSIAIYHQAQSPTTSPKQKEQT